MATLGAEAQNASYEQRTGHSSNMDNGGAHNTQLAQNEVGELYEVELGQASAGEFSEFFLLALGGFPDSQLRTQQSRVEGNLQTDADADAADTVQARIRLTDKQRDVTYAKTRWYSKTELEASNDENLPVLEFQGFEDAEFIREGRIAVIEVMDPTGTVTLGSDHSRVDFPFVGGS